MIAKGVVILFKNGTQGEVKEIVTESNGMKGEFAGITFTGVMIAKVGGNTGEEESYVEASREVLDVKKQNLN